MNSFLHNLIAALARDTPAYSLGPATSDSAGYALLRALARPVPPRMLPERISPETASEESERDRSLKVPRKIAKAFLIVVGVVWALVIGIAAVRVSATMALSLLSLTASLVALAVSLARRRRDRAVDWIFGGGGGVEFVNELKVEQSNVGSTSNVSVNSRAEEAPQVDDHIRAHSDSDLNELANRLALALQRGLSLQERAAIAAFQEAGFEVEVEGVDGPSALSREYREALAFILSGDVNEGISMIERMNEFALAEGVRPPVRVVRPFRRRVS